MVQFVDEVSVEVQGGHGGNGAVAFRREKFVPLGGPSGGDGGDGGDVLLRAESRLTTLMDLRYQKRMGARSGEDGRGKDQYGKQGADRVVRVPEGTQVYDADTGELLADLAEPGSEVIVAHGGKGGRGNIHFATPELRAPRHAESGGRGEYRRLRLVLKLLADVGVVGFPNVGKSTFISTVSRAHPKIADYPFTTLVPNLGVASLGVDRSFVLADIPGIIEGAAEGAGLGVRFLKHLERTRVLLHILTADVDPARHPVEDFNKLMSELERFDPELAQRPMVVAVSKSDLPDARAAFEEVHEALSERGYEVRSMSAATGEGVQEVLQALERLLNENPRPGAQEPSRAESSVSDRPHGNQVGFPEPPEDWD